jgi:hypothetical protein
LPEFRNEVEMPSCSLHDVAVMGAGGVSNVERLDSFEPVRESFGFSRPEGLT